ncbi:CoA transferase [soil metagenome]
MTDSLPLAGMRVIELSSYIASPLGGMTLAQLGADVIRIDPIGGAADRNRWPLAPNGASLYWAGLNKGKRSLAVNLRSEEGRLLISDLVASSGPDGGIMLTNAWPRPGLTYEDLRLKRPDVIHLLLNGRRDGTTAVDYLANAVVGFPLVTGPAELAEPVNHVMPAWDVAAGLYIAVGLLAAERRRSRTGLGQRIEIALEDVAVATAGNLGYLGEAELSTHPRQREGNQVYGDFGRTFATSDGVHVMILTLTPRHWQDLIRIMDFADAVPALEKALSADLEDGDQRYEHRDVINGFVTPWFAARTFAEVEAALTGSSLLWSRYNSFSELVSSDDYARNPMLARIEQAETGGYLAPGAPLLLDGTQIAPEMAPTIGQHTDEVLAGLLDLEVEQICDLRERSIVA